MRRACVALLVVACFLEVCVDRAARGITLIRFEADHPALRTLEELGVRFGPTIDALLLWSAVPAALFTLLELARSARRLVLGAAAVLALAALAAAAWGLVQRSRAPLVIEALPALVTAAALLRRPSNGGQWWLAIVPAGALAGIVWAFIAAHYGQAVMSLGAIAELLVFGGIAAGGIVAGLAGEGRRGYVLAGIVVAAALISISLLDPSAAHGVIRHLVELGKSGLPVYVVIVLFGLAVGALVMSLRAPALAIGLFVAGVCALRPDLSAIAGTLAAWALILRAANEGQTPGAS